MASAVRLVSTQRSPVLLSSMWTHDSAPEVRAPFTKSSRGTASLRENGRGGEIRTRDLYVPNVALYQAKLHPDDRRPEAFGLMKGRRFRIGPWLRNKNHGAFSARREGARGRRALAGARPIGCAFASRTTHNPPVLPCSGRGPPAGRPLCCNDRYTGVVMAGLRLRALPVRAGARLPALRRFAAGRPAAAGRARPAGGLVRRYCRLTTSHSRS